MKKVCLQAGHFSKGGGAPEELANNKRITDRVAYNLRLRGIEVYQTDWYAFNDTNVTKVDFDLFLALHCDMDYPNDGGSGFADYADPASDMATNESQRICKVINDGYFKEVGINYKNRSNANTRFYYMWKYLTAKTPCVLLEMGQSVDPHDRVLLGNTDLIANAITKCICVALGVNYGLPVETPAQPPVVNTELERVKTELEALKIAYDKAIKENEVALADKEKQCQEKILAHKKEIINFTNLLK